MKREPRLAATAPWALALVCALVPAQNPTSIGISTNADVPNYVDGNTVTITSPTGCWTMPVARATLDMEEIGRLFDSHPDELVTFLYQTDIFPLIGPGVTIPAGMHAVYGWMDAHITTGGCEAPVGAWKGTAIRDALLMMMQPSVLNYQGVLPVLPSASEWNDANVCSPIDPLVVASFLATAFVPALPPPGSPAELVSENARRFLQLSVPDGAPTSTAGITVWNAFGYASWASPYTPQIYRDYWSSILANHVDQTTPGPGPLSNPTVISIEKWASTTLKAAMGRDDAAAYLLTKLRTALATAYPNGAPPIEKLPICIKILPIAVEDPSAVAAVAGLPVQSDPNAAPGILAAIPPSGTPPAAPRLRFGNPLSFCLSLRELKSLTGTRNGDSFNGSAAGGKLKLPMGGAALGSVVATVLASGVTHQIEMLPDVRPGMYVGNLPASVTPGTVVRVNALVSVNTTLTGSGGPLYLLTAQP